MAKVLDDCKGIYFIELGKFSDVKNCFKFPDGYDFSCFAKEPTIYKFGKTTNIASRIKDHISNFKKCNINLSKNNLKVFIPIENDKLKSVEENLLKTFGDMYRNFPFTGIDDTRRKELIFLHDDELKRVIDEIQNPSKTVVLPPKEIRKLEIIDMFQDISGLYKDYVKLSAFESSIQPFKDIDLTNYSNYCLHLEELKQYLFKRDGSIVMYIEPKNQPRNFYKNIRLVKFEEYKTIPNVAHHEQLARCKVGGDEYWMYIPRFPC
jgi:hypothetical protein